MPKLPSKEVIQMLAVMTELFDRAPSKDAARVLAMDLADYPDEAVMAGLQRCRKELSKFPTLADILARIDDGRPGVEEAWAMLPKNEAESVVWTSEMAEAYGIVRHMIESDPIAARMAFREKYLKLLTEARSRIRLVKWEPCLGDDKSGRHGAIAEAVRLGRLSHEHGRSLLPMIENTSQKLLSGPDEEVDPRHVKEGIAGILAKIVEHASPEQRVLALRKPSPVDPDAIEARRRELQHQLKVIEGDV